jgi:hypothetical protein
MRSTVPLALAASALLLLAACTAPADSPEPDSDPAPSADQPCIVGTWNLDAADYGAQSEEFVLGLGLPITDFAMTGDGKITFTDDGLVATEIDLTITGNIVAGGTTVPVNQRSAYTATGDWSAGSEPDTIDLENWANVPDDAVLLDPAAPPVPAIDFTDIPTVAATCTANDLVLQGPDAPLSSLWHR